jgi:hypothetical protein
VIMVAIAVEATDGVDGSRQRCGRRCNLH